MMDLNCVRIVTISRYHDVTVLNFCDSGLIIFGFAALVLSLVSLTFVSVFLTFSGCDDFPSIAVVVSAAFAVFEDNLRGGSFVNC